MSSVSPTHSNLPPYKVNDVSLNTEPKQGFGEFSFHWSAMAALIDANEFETNNPSYKLITSQPRKEHAKKKKKSPR